MRKTIFFFILASISAVAFVNCSQFEVGSKLASISAQCVADTREKGVPSFDVASVCEQPANYVCDRRIFRPGVGNSRKAEKPCLEVAGLGSACITTNVFTYDTEPNRNEPGTDASAMEPGGTYNHEEVQCANMAVKSGHISLINAEAESLPAALEAAVQRCRRGGS